MRSFCVWTMNCTRWPVRRGSSSTRRRSTARCRRIRSAKKTNRFAQFWTQYATFLEDTWITLQIACYCRPRSADWTRWEMIVYEPACPIVRLWPTTALYSVPSRVWTVPSLSAWKFWKIRDDFNPDGQLDSIAPPARSNPTARRGWNHLEFFKIFMQTGTELSTLSMGQSINPDGISFSMCLGGGP